MKLTLRLKENESLKTKIKNKQVNYYLLPENNEDLDIISQFLASFDVKSYRFRITLPENTQDTKLLNLTKSIGKSSHKVNFPLIFYLNFIENIQLYSFLMFAKIICTFIRLS